MWKSFTAYWLHQQVNSQYLGHFLKITIFMGLWWSIFSENILMLYQ